MNDSLDLGLKEKVAIIAGAGAKGDGIGNGRAAAILLAEAKRESESIRGNGDGQAIKIYADAFGKDAKFFKFYRSMLAYEKTFVDKDTTMILSPESEFFDFFSDKKGN